MDNVRKVPDIRFKGFDDEWKIVKFQNVGNFYSGGTPLSHNDSYYDGNIPFIRSGEINKNKTELYLSEEGLINSSARLVKTGDVLLALYGATSGEVSISKIDGAINQAILAIIPNDNFSNYFIKNYFVIKKSEINTKYLQGGQKNLSGKIIKSIDGKFPKNCEQSQIGSFFKSLDEKLELEEEKYKKLINFKKAMLEDMFAKEREKVPKVRFDGFDDEWNVLQLKDLGQKYTSLTGKTKDDFGHGDGRYVTFSNVLANPVSSIYGVEKIEIDNSQNAVKQGDLFFNISSETYDEVGMSSVWTHNVENYYLNSFCMGFRPSIKMNNHFITYLLRSRSARKQIMKLAQGISRINISQTKMMDIFLCIPSPEEQTLIGNFFKNLDEKIELSEKKIKKIENFKKAMLDKMFV